MLRSLTRSFRLSVLDRVAWINRGYAPPYPWHIKIQTLLRHGTPDGTWVETGTFLGETTRELARHANRVYTLEPEPTLYQRAAERLSKLENVTVINSPSETCFPDLLPKLSGPVNFWLDGHYSGEATYKGGCDTPILAELAQIETNLERYSKTVVIVDDVRCFDPTVTIFGRYPPLDALVDWARRNRLRWSIENDMFIAR